MWGKYSTNRGNRLTLQIINLLLTTMIRFIRHILLILTAFVMVATAKAQEKNMTTLLGVDFDTFFDNTEYSGTAFGGSGTIFSAIAIFTFLYALTFLITYLIKKWVKSLDQKVDVIEKNKRQKIEEKKKQNEYKPLYKK